MDAKYKTTVEKTIAKSSISLFVGWKIALRFAFALAFFGFITSSGLLADTTTTDVVINLIDVKRSSVTISYESKTRQLQVAEDVSIVIDGKESNLRDLLPSDSAMLAFDKERALVTNIVVNRTVITPAEQLAAGWDEIDQRLLFLMVRLANVEVTLEAVENVLEGKDVQLNAKLRSARQADKANEDLDRKGGGPIKWSEFYGVTAEKFFYHPTDRNSTYHTETLLSQQGSQADNKVGGGVPSSQGLPVHQRPPQFDYIYRANEGTRDRAESEASALKGKLQQLAARRQRLEAEQAGLWVEVAFRAISHYDLDKKPLYRFEPLMIASDTDSRQKTEAIKSASLFMAVALSIISESENNQAATFTRIKPKVSEARRTLNDSFLRLSLDASNQISSVGRFVALAKRLEDVAANLTDSYVVAMEGDSARDKQRKETFRAQLQQSLLGYAEIVLALDEMSSLMEYEYAFKPDIEKPIKLVGIDSFGNRKQMSPGESFSSRGTKPERFTNDLRMEFALIPAGTFSMGTSLSASELVQRYPGSKEEYYNDEFLHEVVLSKPFYMGMFEVTRGQFQEFVDKENYKTEAERDGTGGYGFDQATIQIQNPKFNWRNTGFQQKDDHPVVNITWSDANAFCEWLSRVEGRQYRLPTEAEWEYACRAGTTSEFAYGDDPDQLGEYGNVADMTLKKKSPKFATIRTSDGSQFTSRVGSYLPNPFGIFDMHGNVWEWCGDWHSEYPQGPITDPNGPLKGSLRVLRGGSWTNDASGCRSADRNACPPSFRHFNAGFRVVLNPSEANE
jgi:formylglycine-generating enzyme required for sulfatase activity